MPRNWARIGKGWLPISSLAETYRGPVLFADKSQTIQWFSAKADRAGIEHDGKQLKPSFWAAAEFSD